MSFDDNKHDDIHHTDISQSNCHIGLGETFTPNPIHTVHSYVDWLAIKREYLDTPTLAEILDGYYFISFLYVYFAR